MILFLDSWFFCVVPGHGWGRPRRRWCICPRPRTWPCTRARGAACWRSGPALRRYTRPCRWSPRGWPCDSSAARAWWTGFVMSTPCIKMPQWLLESHSLNGYDWLAWLELKWFEPGNLSAIVSRGNRLDPRQIWELSLALSVQDLVAVDVQNWYMTIWNICTWHSKLN